MGATASSGPVTLTVDQIRQALDRSGEVNWSRVILRGSRCVLLPPASEGPRTPAAKPKAEPDRDVTAGTIRQAVLARVAQVAQTDSDSVRVTFDDRDREVLDTPVRGRIVEVNPAGISDKLPLAIAVYEGDRIVVSRTIRVGVEVLRAIVTTRDAIRRGATIDAGNVQHEERWMPLTAKVARPEDVAGSTAQNALRAGAIVMSGDLTAAVAAQKGDVVSVRVVSGSVVLTTKGRALDTVQDGQYVRLQALDGRREFVARMDGRQRAVIVAGSTPDVIEPAPRSVASTRGGSGRATPPVSRKREIRP
jgi:flagella basal body P-ring formation protein FlgA